MNLTKFTDYSLRTLVYLGLREDETRATPAAEIADAYGISHQHLVKVVQHLVKSGYLHSTRGRSGGLRLAQPAKDINVGQVVRATEDFSILECFERESSDCVITNACRLRAVLRTALRSFLAELDRHTLADVLSQPEQLRELLSLGTGPADLRDPPAKI